MRVLPQTPRPSLALLVALLTLSLPVASFAMEMFGMTAEGKLVGIDPDVKPLATDILARPAPEYPLEDRRASHQGSGLFRIVFDPKTGRVKEIIVRKSTGWPTLDNASIAGFRQWRVKPGKWRYIELPIAYVKIRR
jgi:TonB family protein